jgi:hypothetical protein
MDIRKLAVWFVLGMLGGCVLACESECTVSASEGVKVKSEWPAAKDSSQAPRVGMDFGEWKTGKKSGEKIIRIDNLPCKPLKVRMGSRTDAPGRSGGPKKGPVGHTPTIRLPDLPPPVVRECVDEVMITERRWWPAAKDPAQPPKKGMDYGEWTTGKKSGEKILRVESDGPCKWVRTTSRTIPEGHELDPWRSK